MEEHVKGLLIFCCQEFKKAKRKIMNGILEYRIGKL